MRRARWVQRPSFGRLVAGLAAVLLAVTGFSLVIGGTGATPGYADSPPPGMGDSTEVTAGNNYEGVDLEVGPDACGASGAFSATLDGATIPVPDYFPSDNVPPGEHNLVLQARDDAGNVTTATCEFSTSVGNIPASRFEMGQVGRPPYASPDGPTLVAVGDIACPPGSTPTPTSCQQASTAALVKGINPDAVATAADDQYPTGSLSNFLGSYDKTWGAFKDITYPAIGNHEYADNNFADNNYPGAQAPGYFDYFDGVGNATGRAGDRNRGYYSYNLGSWHIVVLNAGGGSPNLGETGKCGVVSCVKGSGQQVWLANDLAANQNRCTLAVWHQPHFSAGDFNDGGSTRPLWDTLYAHGADVIINGHDHDYQRWAPQTPSGQADPAHGIREFIVGTGGDSHHPLVSTPANLQAANNDTFGVLQLQLHPDSYTWHFIPAPGTGTYTDAGTARCHGAPAP